MDNQIDKVSIYKINDNVKNFDECMSEKVLKNKLVDIKTSSLIGKFYYDEIKSQNRKEDIPWIKFFNEKIKNKLKGKYINTYSRGVFFYKLKNENDIYIMLFGIGADGFINKNKITFDFGIKVAMNICDPCSLKRVQSSKIEAITLHSEKQINNGAKLSIFDIDDEKEFLRKISTKPLKKYDYISVITGSEAVQIKFNKDNKLNWSEITEITNNLNQLYYSKKYKETFKNYDNFIFINDKNPIKEALEEILLNNLKQKKIENVYLTTPEFFDYENFEFSYTKSDKKDKNKAKRFSELSLEDCLEQYKIKDTTSIDTLKSWTIFKFDTERAIFSKLSSVYKCLVAEIDYNNKKFILFNGRWRQVDEDLQNRINLYFARERIEFENYDDNVLLNNISIWDEKRKQYREAVYNEKCAKNNENLFMFDRSSNDYGEMCDLLSLNKELIHVKRYECGSASISHLFVQVKYYADTFISETEARKQMREFIDNDVLNENTINYKKQACKFKDIIPEKSPNDNCYTIVLCVLTEQQKHIQDLPFMAQYEMYHTHKYLTNNRHFNVKFVNKIIIKN